ncbi:hypothetical protein [Pleionea sediminis]|uniref:hypothetical protein n=1 Tax=Pleionea sediminis TaxID=2569479 RepID=UPI0011848849|nr:hypothetical protein [Pleionea sediminis]
MKHLLVCSALVFSTLTSAKKLEEVPEIATEKHSVNHVLMEQQSVVDPITMSTVGGWILSGAKSAIVNGVKSFIKDALFGSGGPDYVLLHEQSLQQIENIVREVVLTSDVEDAKSELLSFQDMMEYYNASAQDDSPDLSILPLLINYATSLKNHRAYRDSYNDNAYLLTGSYSLAAALTIAVFVEKELQGEIDHAYVVAIANSLHQKLTELGSQANSYISRNIQLRYPTGRCDDIIIRKDGVEKSEVNNDVAMKSLIELQPKDDASFGYTRGSCTYIVYDRISGRNYFFHIADMGRNLASRLSMRKRNQLVQQYKDQIKGKEYNQIVNQLDNM